MTRRRALKLCGGAVAAAPAVLPGAFPNDIQIEEVRTSYDDFLYRAPYKFGGVEVDRVTILNVHCRVRGRGGKTAEGFGSMTLGNVWSFPSKKLTYVQTLDAMRRLAEKISRITAEHREWGHPIDLNVQLEPAYAAAAAEISKTLADPIPLLCVLVAASPFDAAIHDAYGKLHRRNSFLTLGPEFLRNDLSHYLGPEFRGETLDRYVLAKPQPELPLYHSVGASDPIFSEDVIKPVRDGLPETLPEWIAFNGITNIKIKLNGDDREWDLNRVVRIHQATEKSGRENFVYSLDFNERCPDAQYLLDYLRELKSRAPKAYARLQYIEQPTARDLDAHPADDVHAAAKLIPVVIDESLTGKEAFLMALKMGYSGAALKACKGQSQCLLLGALGQKRRVFLCIQDLTCPGASLVHSVTIAAHIPGLKAVEANARQYVPVANRDWESRFPGIFKIKDGIIRTRGLEGPGLGVVPA